MTIPFTMEQIFTACIETVRVNKLQHCYVRPIVFRGYGAFGVNPFPAPVETYIICFPWGRYLGSDALEAGVDVCTSSWRACPPIHFPPRPKPVPTT
jgi:branched-chain amino acid aminotransferase